jgi:hypothetical protein
MHDTSNVERRIAEVHDRLAVQDGINELFLATDLKDWERVKATFADEVVFDMTSLAGGEPSTMTPQAIADAWAEGLGPVEAVHHQTGNYVVQVNGDMASASCYGTATHYRPNEEKSLTYFVGSYDFHLVRAATGWKIDRFRFNKKYVA